MRYKGIVVEALKSTCATLLHRPLVPIIIFAFGVIVILVVRAIKGHDKPKMWIFELSVGASAMVAAGGLLFAWKLVTVTPRRLLAANDARLVELDASRLAQQDAVRVLTAEKAEMAYKLDNYNLIPGLTNASFSEKLDALLKNYDELLSKNPSPPRHLTTEQRAALLEGLKKISGRGITIRAAQSSNEASSYADEFKAVFTEAGWIPRSPKPWVAGRDPSGLLILHNSTNAPTPPPDAIALYQVLSTAGLIVGGKIVTGLDAGTVELFVGLK